MMARLLTNPAHSRGRHPGDTPCNTTPTCPARTRCATPGLRSLLVTGGATAITAFLLAPLACLLEKFVFGLANAYFRALQGGGCCRNDGFDRITEPTEAAAGA